MYTLENRITMKPFDLEAAKRGAAVCTKYGDSAQITEVDMSDPIPISADVTMTLGMSYYPDGKGCCNSDDLMMRDDDYLERLERGEYISPARHQEGDPTVKEKLTVATCQEHLPVGLTKREWFAGMALAGEIAGFFAGDCCVKGEGKMCQRPSPKMRFCSPTP